MKPSTTSRHDGNANQFERRATCSRPSSRSARLGTPSLLVALDYLELLAEAKPEKLEPAAVRWHGRLEVEAATMTLAESQLALAALASLCAGERDAVAILRRLVRRVRPTLVRGVG